MKFIYKARTKDDQIQEGVIEASNRRSALEILEKYGLYITSLESEEKSIWAKPIVLTSKISEKDIIAFTRQIATMFKSAVPPVETFKALILQTENPIFREKILKISENVEAGTPLSRAFSFFPGTFNSFYVSCVRSGEASGKLADSLNYLAEHLEREYNLKEKIRSAMIYPIFVISVFIAVFLIAIFFVVPRLAELMEMFAGKMPFLTKAVISLADFFTKRYGWVLFLIIFGFLIALFVILRASKEGKKFWDKVSLKIPILGDFYKKIYLTRFSENLSVLISSGLPITQALVISGSVIENDTYKGIIKEAEKRVERGETISSVLAKYPKEVPSFLVQMISTGEKTGRLENILMDVVSFYRAEIERATNNLINMLEPILIIFLGLAVGILVVSLFLPLFQIGISGISSGM